MSDSCTLSLAVTRRSLIATTVFSLTMLVLAVVANSVMDTLSFRYQRSVFKPLGHAEWFDPAVSWTRKWKDGDPAKGDAFPLSSTALVAVTDAWHLAKFLCISFILLALLAPFTLLLRLPWWGWIIVFLMLKISWGLIFESLFAGGFIVR